MQVRRYKPTDYHLIEEWMKKHEMDIPLVSRLPKWGIVVGECAMVFVVKTDCKIALLEYFITDPEAPKEQRQEACDLGIKHAEAYALSKGYHIIAATVTVPRVAELLHSWKYISDAKPYVMFRKLLERTDNVRDDSCKPSEPSTSASQ